MTEAARSGEAGKVEVREHYLAADKWEKWNVATKQKLGVFAGLTWWGSTGGQRPEFHIVARHWPHLACWSWFLSWSCVHVEGGEVSKLRIYRHEQNVTVQFWRRRLTLHRQQHYFMPSKSYETDAPDPIRVNPTLLSRTTLKGPSHD